ncbi:MAG: hypothetical protein HY652_03210 [Acidobacteria bacterium]|nr:hypothetical protein [Acidobacteriota bacterium]
MGLIQRALERAGIATISISILRRVTESVRPPRSVFVRFPFGHALGEAGNTAQQMTLIRDSLKALYQISEPGTILDLPYRWRRETYSAPSDWEFPRP